MFFATAVVFAGYQYLRDYDTRRIDEQDKVFAKLTWRLAPGWQLLQSIHREWWENPESPTLFFVRIRGVLSDDYLMPEVDLPFATISHGVAFYVEKVNQDLPAGILRDMPAATLTLEAYRNAQTSSTDRQGFCPRAPVRARSRWSLETSGRGGQSTRYALWIPSR